MANADNLTPFTKDDDRASKAGHVGGSNKKGSKHINTWVQELLHDEEFETWIYDAKNGIKEYKGAPIKAVVQAQITKALAGDTKAYDSLFKSGWPAKTETDITSNGEQIGATDPALAAEFASFMKSKQ